MRSKVLFPLFALAALMLVVGLACGLSVDMTEAPDQPPTNPSAPTATAVVVPSVPTATAVMPAPPSPTPVAPAPGPAPAPAPGPGPAPSGNTLDYSLSPNYGSQNLSAGFVPDPFQVNLTSGGSVNASYLGGGCGGYATSAPDFRLNWSGTSSRLRIMFVASTAGQDATLIVNAANGTWLCNDDYGGLNPMVEINNPSPGQYDIWVGSYQSGQYIGGTLKITELNLTP